MVFAVSLALLTRSIKLWMSCCRGLVGSIVHLRSFSAASKASLYVSPNSFVMILFQSVIPLPHVVDSGNKNCRLSDVAIHMTTYSLQFLFPESTTCGNGITLWSNIITKLFGLTYKDAFEAAEKLRRWNIDPSKPLQHDIHNLMLLVKRANETAKTVLPEASILGMIYDAISKDPRDELS